MKRLTAMLLSLVLLTACAVFCFADEMAEHKQNIVVADTPEVYAEVTDLRFSEVNQCYEVEIYFCNRTDHAMEVESKYACINGYVMDSYMFDAFAAQRKSIDYLEILTEDFEILGTDTVDELKFRLVVRDTENEVPVILFDEVITLYPTGKKPEEIQVKQLDDFPYCEAGMSNEFIDFRVLDAKLTENGVFYQISGVAENRAGKDIVLSGTNMVIDGVATEPYWYTVIPTDAKAVTDLWIDAEKMAESGVYNYDNISFTLMLYDWTTPFNFEDSMPFFAYPFQFCPAKG